MMLTAQPMVSHANMHALHAVRRTALALPDGIVEPIHPSTGRAHEQRCA